MIGTILKVVYDRGFCFIKTDEYESIFCHYTSLRNVELRDVNSGDEVEFDIVDSDKGPVAKNVIVHLQEEGEREEGTITSVKGSYGYLEDTGGQSLFFHFSACRFYCTEAEHEGAKVTFVRAPNERGGYKATRIELT